MNTLQLFHKKIAQSHTGKLNLLAQSTGQHLGDISIINKIITQFLYKGLYNKKAIELFAIDLCINKIPIDYILEPEIISSSCTDLNLSFELLIKLILHICSIDKLWFKFQPPINAQIDVSNSITAHQLSLIDLEVICEIIDSGTIRTLYEKTNMLRSDLTKTLIALKKRGIISLSANRHS